MFFLNFEILKICSCIRGASVSSSHLGCGVQLRLVTNVAHEPGDASQIKCDFLGVIASSKPQVLARPTLQ